MEDLGNINITIRDGAGGGGGGGVGGGPNALAQRSMVLANQPIRIAQAVIKIDQAVIMQFGQAMQRAIAGSVAQAVPPVYPRQDPAAPFGRLARFQELQSELMAFGQRPTLGSALSLVRSNTATSQAIAGMGRAAMGVSTALVAVGAVGGTVAVTLGALQMASAHAASRIEEVWRFSSATTGAMAEQQVARFVMQIKEAAINGEVYARAIRAQTDSNNAYAAMQIKLGRTTAEMDRVFSRLKEKIFDLTSGALGITEMAQEVAGYTPIGAFAEAIDDINEGNKKLGLTTWQSLQWFITDLIGGKAAADKLLQSYLAEIARNTDKDAGGDAANEWFQADIKAMTGLPY